MTFEQTIADIIAKRDAIPEAMAAGRRAIGVAAVEDIKAVWPVGSGPGPRSRDGWDSDDDRVFNDVPHTPYVHDGLADRLVPDVLRRLQHIYDETVTAALDSAGVR